MKTAGSPESTTESLVLVDAGGTSVGVSDGDSKVDEVGQGDSKVSGKEYERFHNRSRAVVSYSRYKEDINLIQLMGSQISIFQLLHFQASAFLLLSTTSLGQLKAR